MIHFLQKPFVLTLVMIVTFTWFSYLWWQDQKEQNMADFLQQSKTAQALPDAYSLPTLPPNPDVAAAALSQ